MFPVTTEPGCTMGASDLGSKANQRGLLARGIRRYVSAPGDHPGCIHEVNTHSNVGRAAEVPPCSVADGCELFTCCGFTLSSAVIIAPIGVSSKREGFVPCRNLSIQPTLWFLSSRVLSLINAAARTPPPAVVGQSRCMYVRTRATIPPAVRIRTAVGEPTPKERAPPPSTAPHLHKPKRRHTQVSSGYMPCGVCGRCRPHVTCGRAPPHHPLAGSERQWESRPRGTSTTTQHSTPSPQTETTAHAG